MVKSYKGVEKVAEKPSPRRPVTAEHYMSKNLVTFRPDQTMNEVMDILIKKRISGGPVIDETGALVGVISEGDCLKQVVKGKYHNMPTLSGKVAEFMATDVQSIPQETNIFELAQMFLSRRLRRFPVLHNGRLVGQISQKDVMKAVIELAK